MWRPSGLQHEATNPADPSSILQCQSGCSKDQTYIRKEGKQAGTKQTAHQNLSLQEYTSAEKKLLHHQPERARNLQAVAMKDWRWIPLQK